MNETNYIKYTIRHYPFMYEFTCELCGCSISSNYWHNDFSCNCWRDKDDKKLILIPPKPYHF